MSLVLATEVESAADGGEVCGRDGLVQDRGTFTQDGRAAVKTESAGFAAFEILQSGLQQALYEGALLAWGAKGGGGQDMDVAKLVAVNVQARAVVLVQGLGQ